MNTVQRILPLLFAAVTPCMAQDLSAQRPSSLFSLPETDTPEPPRSSWKVIPLAAYLPNSGFVAGGYFSVKGLLFEADKAELYGASSVGEQRSVNLDYSAPDFLDTRLELKGFVSYSNFSKGYYGRGNETSAENREKFLPGKTEIGFSLGRSLGQGLTLEAGLVQRSWDPVADSAQSLIPLADLAGGNNRFMRFTLRRDTRDDDLEPRTGGNDRLRFESSLPELGSSYDFSRMELRLARYRPISERQVLALRFDYGTILNGEAPVFELEQLGGSSRLRGESGGRYRANSSMLFGAEWRLRINKPVSFVVFADAGKVWDDTDAFTMTGFHATGGIGLRYRISDGCLLRLDLGLGSNGRLKPAMDVNQAF